jgi:hypothetical protein
MKNVLPHVLFIAIALRVSPAILGHELPGEWILQVQNPKHQLVATLKVQFTDTRAESCMSGDWKVLKVVSAKSTIKDFSPILEPLSYQIKNGKLTIGRNQICDAYLWLQGAIDGSSVQGDYFSLGLGSRSPLGYFKLSRSK